MVVRVHFRLAVPASLSPSCRPCLGDISVPMVGSSGLEPPTSRLSGVRSNHLSYEPMSARTPVSCLRPARFPGSFRGSLDSLVSTVSSFSPSFTSCRGAAAFRQPFQTTRKNSGGVLARHLPRCAKCLGGDEQTRTVDPLLARQVLSHLSYTPMSAAGLLPTALNSLRLSFKKPLEPLSRSQLRGLQN